MKIKARSIRFVVVLNSVATSGASASQESQKAMGFELVETQEMGTLYCFGSKPLLSGIYGRQWLLSRHYLKRRAEYAKGD
jgi:hypothetical protein